MQNHKMQKHKWQTFGDGVLFMCNIYIQTCIATRMQWVYSEKNIGTQLAPWSYLGRLGWYHRTPVKNPMGSTYPRPRVARDFGNFQSLTVQLWRNSGCEVTLLKTSCSAGTGPVPNGLALRKDQSQKETGKDTLLERGLGPSPSYMVLRKQATSNCDKLWWFKFSALSSNSTIKWLQQVGYTTCLDKPRPCLPVIKHPNSKFPN